MYSSIRVSDQTRSFLNRARIGFPDEGKVIALALARAVVDRLPLPTSPVEDSSIYYTGQAEGLAQELIGNVNEVFVIDTNQALTFTRELWRAKYRILFPQGPLFDSSACQIAAFLGLSSSLSEEFVKLTQTHVTRLTLLANGFADALRDICPAAAPEAAQDSPVDGGPIPVEDLQTASSAVASTGGATIVEA